MNTSLKFKLCPFGKKHSPYYRIGIMPTYRSPSRGYVLEFLGYYNPITKDFKVDKEKVNYYLSQGAKMSKTINSLFLKNSIINK